LKPVRLLLSIVGLIAIILAYVTGKLEFLIVALVAFAAGLYYMGAIGKRSSSTKDQDSETERKKSAKDKSQKQQ